MSVADQITRINTAKNDIKTAIQGKGVTVPSSAKLDTYSNYIDIISNIDSNYVSNKYALFYKGRFNDIIRQLNYIDPDADYGYCFYKHTGLSTDDWNWLKSHVFLHPLTSTKIDVYYNNMFQNAKITAPTNKFIFDFNDLNTGSSTQVYMDYQHMFDGINVTSGNQIKQINNLPAFITKACAIRRNAADTEIVGFQPHFEYMFANISDLSIGDDVILDFTRSNPESISGHWDSHDYCDGMFMNTTFNNSTDLTLQYTTQSFEDSHHIDGTKTMFEGCDANSVTFKNIGFKNIGVEKSSIKNIYFNNCTYMASANCFMSAFSGNTALKSIDLTNLTPESSTYCTQPAYMFSGCTALKTIDFGTNVLIRYYNYSTANNTKFTKMFNGCTALQTITNFPINIYTNGELNVFGDTNLTNLTSISCNDSTWYSSKKNLTIDLSKCTALNPTTFINTIPTNAGKSTTVTLKFAAAVYNALTSTQKSALSSKNILYISA